MFRRNVCRVGEATNKSTTIYLEVIGAVSTLLIFNQVYVGTNLSIVWIAVMIAPVLCDRHPLRRSQVALALLLLAFAAKFLVVMNLAAIVRYATYIAFVSAAMISLQEAEFDRFFRGFEIGVACNIAFACVQIVGKVSGAYDAVFPVESWNPSLWHSNPDGGMFTFFPRVSGLTNEPAYLGTIVITMAAYRLFVQKKKTLSGRYGVVLFLVIMLLVNSRTACVSYMWLIGCSILLQFEKMIAVRYASYAMYVVSFVIMPLTIVYSTNGYFDYDTLLQDDVSVFARTVPLTWIREGNNLDVSNYLFGVGNYRTFAQTVDMPATAYSAFELQGGLLDAKSLGGAYFYDLGIVGLATFIGAVGLLCNWRIRSLLLFSIININFFNVYAYSWPLFWLMLVACGLPLRETGGASVAMPRLLRFGKRGRASTSLLAYLEIG